MIAKTGFHRNPLWTKRKYAADNNISAKDIDLNLFLGLCWETIKFLILKITGFHSSSRFLHPFWAVTASSEFPATLLRLGWSGNRLASDMFMIEVRKASHCAYKILYRMIFAIKYRRKLLQDSDRITYIKLICSEIGERYWFDFDAIGTDGDHVHVFVGASPR